MNAENTPAINVQGLSKRFGDKVVVQDFSIRVERGQIVGFLGPNGSGKTTTIRMLCGLLRPDSGRGRCLGHDILTESWAIKNRVGYMTQRFSLYEDLTIRENLDFVARLYRIDRRDERVNQALSQLGLAGRGGQLAGTLSGGWKQRLALAACTLHEPLLLLLDEPTAGVDPKARREFWDEIHGFAQAGMTVLVSTHYMDEAERCHRIAYITYGKLLTTGTVPEVIGQSGLTTWIGSGPQAAKVARALEEDPDVAMVAPFGLEVHASGTDPRALKAAIGRHGEGMTWRSAEPTLEDVFIHLMSRARDNFAEGAG